MKFLLFTALLMIFFIFFISCGFEDLPYLYPPVVPVETNLIGNSFVFKNNSQNPDKPECQGYEFFYKIYNSVTVATVDKSIITQAIAKYTTDEIRARMLDIGYKRISMGISLESVQDTLLSVPDPADDSYNITLTFPVAEEPYISCPVNTPINLIISRQPDIASSNVSFRSISLDDKDVANTNPGDYLYVQVYAIALGIRLTDFINIYSTPAFLGILQLP